MRVKAGDWVQVRSSEEILATLDKVGRLEGLPFMPQMFQYCGQKFKIYKRAHKTCDTVIGRGGRKLTGGVHLELRCDGEAYGGCQAACLIFWKEAWLKPLGKDETAAGSSQHDAGRRQEMPQSEHLCTEADVNSSTRVTAAKDDQAVRYSCQATEVLNFTTSLRWWDLRQYVEDFTSGNATLGRILRGFVYAGYFKLCHLSKNAEAPFYRLYDSFQAITGGIPYPRYRGSIPIGQPTPTSTLDLQPGELVRVKSYPEILATLDTSNKNRGLFFDAEMVPYCGGTYRVRTRVYKFLDEKTGEMRTLKTPAIILENVWCQSRYSDCRMFCPRSIYSWWREVWLQRA